MAHLTWMTNRAAASEGRAIGRLWRSIERWHVLLLGVTGLLALLMLRWPDPFWRMTLFLLDGLAVTVGVTLIAFALILLIGLLGGLGRISPNAALRSLAALYVDIVRGIPLLVQLLFLYYAFPQLLHQAGAALAARFPTWTWAQALATLQFSPFWAAVMGLSFCYGAYMTEVFRAGFEAIPRGQMEAALALGMSRAQALRVIILPQAMRMALPPIGNDFISLLKDSSLVSVVAVADLTRRGREFISAAFIPVEGWTLVALLYLLLTLLVSRLVSGVERRFQMVERS